MAAPYPRVVFALKSPPNPASSWLVAPDRGRGCRRRLRRAWRMGELQFYVVMVIPLLVQYR